MIIIISLFLYITSKFLKKWVPLLQFEQLLFGVVYRVITSLTNMYHDTIKKHTPEYDPKVEIKVYIEMYMDWFMVLNATFNNISVIS